jgi:hypothetical protein
MVIRVQDLWKRASYVRIRANGNNERRLAGLNPQPSHADNGTVRDSILRVQKNLAAFPTG